MGVIYSPDAVAFGHVPEPGLHEHLAHEIIAQLGTMAIAPGSALQGAKIYGSVARGKPKRNSDVDLLVRFKTGPDTAEEAESLANLLRLWQSGSHVYIDCNILTDIEVESRIGKVPNDPSFVDHLQLISQSGRLIVGDPAQGLMGVSAYLPNERVRVVARGLAQFASHKCGYFFQALGSDRSEEESHRALQRAFELPAKLGRKAITLVRLTSAVGDAPSGAASYSWAPAALSPELVQGLIADARELNELSDEYIDVLEKTIAGTTTISNYAGWLQQTTRYAIKKAMGLSLAALQSSAAYLRESQ